MKKPMEALMTVSSNSNRNAYLMDQWINLLPEEYKDITFSSCRDIKPELIEYTKKALDSSVSLYFYGKWGCGKTTLAFALIRYVLEKKLKDQYFWPRYFSAKEFDCLLLAGSRSDQGDGYILNEMSTHDMLFIDDIDKISPSERFKNQLFEVINVRNIKCKPTIITSNCAPSEISQIIDGAVASRLGDKSKWSVISFPNTDLRKIQEIKF